MKKGFSRQGSFLIEALLSVVILSTSITIIIQSLAIAAKTKSESSRYATAAILADNFLAEKIRKQFIESGVREENHFSQPHEKYKHVFVTQKFNPDFERINQLDLTVSWPIGNGEKKIHVSTLLFEPVRTQ
jgi:hypothetical protein